MRIYDIRADFENIYKEYLSLLGGNQNIAPENYEVDFLIKTLTELDNLKKGSYSVILEVFSDFLSEWPSNWFWNRRGLESYRLERTPISEQTSWGIGLG